MWINLPAAARQTMVESAQLTISEQGTMPWTISPFGRNKLHRYRRSALAIFGGLARLWRADREAAGTILLHEIGHYRQGDPLAQGAGAFFGEYLRRWPLIASPSNTVGPRPD